MTTTRLALRGVLALAAVAALSSLAACGASASGQSAQGVDVEPPTAAVPPGGAVQFSAAVGGASAAVNWTVQESGGGTVSPTGLFTAPATLGTFHVVATSATDPSLSGQATVNVVDVPPSTIIPAARRTTWNPGIPGGTPNSAAFTVHATINAADYGNGTTNAATAINSAIAAAGAVATAASPRVVQLSAGTFRINGQITLDQDYVVLRGAGLNVGGTGGGTRLIMYGVNTDMFSMGSYVDWGAARNVVGDVPKGASSFTLATGHGVRAGDLLVIDKLDDASISLGGGTWWKRGPGGTDNGPASAAGYRSIGQVVEVTGVNGNVITIAGILHHAYPASLSPQVFGSTSRRTGYAGIGLEEMTITGWGDAFGIYANWLRRSWVKHVEFDGEPVAQGGVGTGTRGVDIRVFRSARFAIEKSYLHHSRVYETNNNAYSISLAAQTSDSLVQDNVVWFKNKNIVLEASGGGNVIAYNYVEDPVIWDPPSTTWLEQGIDGSHLSHPSMDLFEGNYTAKMGAADTHGSAGQQTFFRNHSKGNRLYTMTDNAACAAVLIQSGMREMNVVGNVLSTRSGGIYEPAVDASGWLVNQGQSGTPKIFSLGVVDGEWGGPVDLRVAQELLRVANYDYVRSRVDTVPAEPLPDSLYLAGKPAFFGSLRWPWVNPLGTTDAERLGTLPAKARFDAGAF